MSQAVPTGEHPTQEDESAPRRYRRSDGVLLDYVREAVPAPVDETGHESGHGGAPEPVPAPPAAPLLAPPPAP
ncbi:hypothetical protein GTQ99_22495, partial [Kineococcus sp. T13]